MPTNKRYRITRDCSQTRSHEWTEEIFVDAADAEAAEAIAANADGSEWAEVAESHRQEEYYRYPDVEYSPNGYEVEEVAEVVRKKRCADV
jgi:hypothetical protein